MEDETQSSSEGEAVGQDVGDSLYDCLVSKVWRSTIYNLKRSVVLFNCETTVAIMCSWRFLCTQHRHMSYHNYCVNAYYVNVVCAHFNKRNLTSLVVTT